MFPGWLSKPYISDYLSMESGLPFKKENSKRKTLYKKKKKI